VTQSRYDTSVPADLATAQRALGILPPGPFGSLQPVTNRLVFPEQDQSDGSVQDLTYRSRHLIEEDTAFIQLVYVNRSAPFNNPSTAVTYKAAVESVPTGTANLNAIVIRPTTLQGQVSATVSPGGFVISDPIYGPWRKGDEVLVRTYVSVASLGQRWPLGLTLNNSFEGTAAGDATATPNASLSFTPSGPGVAPVAILGQVANKVSVAVLGDSIGDGAGDTGQGWADGGINNIGPFSRYLLGKAAVIKGCSPGERLASVVGGVNYLRGSVAAQCKNIITAYLTNDVLNGDSVATMQANIIAFWRSLSTGGRRVFQPTIDPQTDSSNSWASVAGQTVRANEAKRTAMNSWFRAGAPIDASFNPLTIGTPGAILAGDIRHPCFLVLDTAALVEVNASNALTLNGGFWITNGATNWATSDGTHNSRMASGLKGPAIAPVLTS
jgi:hypothetical protein